MKSAAVKDSDTPRPTMLFTYLHSILVTFIPRSPYLRHLTEVLFRSHYWGLLVGRIGKGGGGVGTEAGESLKTLLPIDLVHFCSLITPKSLYLCPTLLHISIPCFQLSCPLTLRSLLQFPFLLHEYDSRRLALIYESLCLSCTVTYSLNITAYTTSANVDSTLILIILVTN